MDSMLCKLCILAPIFIGAGCVSSHHLQVDAIKNDPGSDVGESYRLVNANPEMDEQDLRFQEAARYVKVALSSHGWYEAPESQDADQVVEIDFGIEGPFYELREVQVFVPAHLLRPEDPRVRQAPTRPLNGTIPDETVARLVPVEVYSKYLRLTAREAQGDGDRAPRQVWSVVATCRDDGEDPRRYLPLLVSATMDYVDRDTPGPEEVVVRESDARLKFVTSSEPSSSEL